MAAFEEEKRLEGSWCALHQQGTLALFGVAHLKRFVAPSLGVVCHLGCTRFYGRARVEAFPSSLLSLGVFYG